MPIGDYHMMFPRRPLRSEPLWSYPMPRQRGWECPKCGRVYGPAAAECVKCNKRVSEGEEA